MTDERDREREPLITRAEAMARARARRPKDPAAERAAGLHDLLRDMAAYLGDRPNRDHEAMALYGRVMRMLGEGGE